MKRSVFARNWCTKGISLVCSLGCLVILLPSLLQAETSTDDSAFIEKKASILAGFQKEGLSLTEEKARLQKECLSLTEDIEKTSGEVDRKRSLATDLSTAYGLNRLFGGFFLVIAYVFFPVAVINHFLYLFFRKKPLFKQYPKTILITLAAVLVFCLLPLLTFAGQEGSVALPGEARVADPFQQKLEAVNRLMTLSPAERQIALMENGREPEVALERTQVKDPFLIPSEGRLEVGSPEFLYTLAGLYRAVGKEEKMQETLKRLDDLPLEEKWFNAYVKIYPRLVELALANNQMMQASRAAHRLIEIYGKQKNSKALIEFSVFLTDHQMTQSANDAIAKAVEVVGPGQDAFDLANDLLGANRGSQASALLGRVIADSENLHDILPVMGFCMEKGLSQEASKAIERAGDLCKTSSDDGVLSRFLYEKGRKEESAEALHRGKERAQQLEDLLAVAQSAREQGFLTLAIEAVERAVMTDPRAMNHRLPSPLLLGETGQLPTEDPISLATYLGILQELDRRMESAETSYKVSPEKTLDWMAENHGQISTGQLNDFFYLKRFWEKQDPEKRDHLLPLYARLQQKALEEATQRGEAGLAALKAEVHLLKKAQETARKDLDLLRSERSQATTAVFLYALRDAAWAVFGILVVIGCLWKGIGAFRSAPRFKFYAFWWRFQESLGWSFILGILLIPIGICLVLWGQFMSMLHSMEKGIRQGA